MFVPLGLHGDGGQFQRNDSINVISFRSLLSSWNVATSQLLLIALPKGCINKNKDDNSKDTMHHIWKVLVWSLEATFYNKFPEMDHMGKDWPTGSWRAKMGGHPLSTAGYRGFLYAIQADGEYMANEFHLNGASMEQMCWNCDANKSSHPYNDFRPTASWRETVVDHKGTSPTEHLVSQVPAVSGLTFKYDILHVLEEGLAAHCIANAAFDMVMRSHDHGTQEERLRNLQNKIAQFYEELGIESEHQVKRFPMSAFCSPKSKWDTFPSLSGIKAKQCRWLVPVFLQICEANLATDEYSQHKYKCFKHLNIVYEVMDSAGMHPSQTDARTFSKAMNSCLLHYSRLSVLCLQQGVLMWNTIPKMHLCQHMELQFRWFNPKFYSCYSGETMVGHMSALGHACLNGTTAHLVPLKIAWRFRLAFHLRSQGAEFNFASSDSED